MQTSLPTFVMHYRLLFPEWQDRTVNTLQGNEAGAVIASNIATPRKFLREIFFATGLRLIQSTKQAQKDVLCIPLFMQLQYSVYSKPILAQCFMLKLAVSQSTN